MSRTQLNINVSPDLLVALKKRAIKSGKTLTTYVSEILSEELKGSDDEIVETDLASIDARIKYLEEKVSLLTNQRE